MEVYLFGGFEIHEDNGTRKLYNTSRELVFDSGQFITTNPDEITLIIRILHEFVKSEKHYYVWKP